MSGNHTFCEHIRKSMLIRVRRVGPSDYSPKTQVGMIEPAEEWLLYWAQLLKENPCSAAGALASLLADAYKQGRLDAESGVLRVGAGTDSAGSGQ
jgi:hypothetical protein